MASLKVKYPDRTEKKIELEEKLTIGSQSNNLLILEDSNVSGYHAQIIKKDEYFILEDISSSNHGTFLDGTKLMSKTSVRLSDGNTIQIGGFTLIFEQPPIKEELALKREDKDLTGVKEGNELDAIKVKIHKMVIEKMDLRKEDIMREEEGVLYDKTEKVLQYIVKEMDSEIPPEINRDELIKEILSLALGYGPLEELLADPTIDEVMVNSKDEIFIERDGRLSRVNKKFGSDAQVLGVIEKIVAPLGRRIDQNSPYVDARLPDGSRVNAIIPPLALKGPSITIRKFKKEKLTDKDLIRFGSITEDIATFLRVCVEGKKNIIISGGTGSGKTTLLNIMASFILPEERIVTIEDAAELKLYQENLVSLESRPPSIEGEGAITIRDLVINSLRMRPDRIVVGECRGKEALDMLQAMNTGHDGSLTTCHANTPRDALARLETMVLMAGTELPQRAIRQQISSAIDLIIQQSRLRDGSRKVTYITEITGMEGEIITLQDIFLFIQTGLKREGDKPKVEGYFTATGFIPTFLEDLEIMTGIKIPREIFLERKRE